MPLLHNSVQTGAANAKELLDFIKAAKVMVHDGPALKAKMAAMIDLDTNPDDYSHLETQFGLATGTGETVWLLVAKVVNLVQTDIVEAGAAGVDGSLAVTKFTQLVSQVG